MRVLSRAAILATLVACLAASTASATVTVSTTGGTINIGSATGSNETYIDFKGADPNFSNTDRITIQNSGGSPFGIVLSPDPHPDCAYDPENLNIKVSCPAANFDDIQANYGADNDTFRFLNVCMPTATVNLGEGTNEYQGQGCPNSAITVSAGSGQDTLSGYGGAGSTADTLNGGGGDDTIYGGDGNDVLHAGDGNDTATDNAGNDQIFGEGGSDTIRGGAGNDVEDGGPGDDDIGKSPGINNDDDQGADDVRGGDGTDRLRLDAHTGGMTISLDDQANDGASGEGDNIHSDFEVIEGTGANDNFSGTPAHDDFDGGNGADTIHGNGGDDTLTGGSDGDQVFGDAGNDTVYGSYGDDRVEGGSGRDSVFGDLASCSSFTCPAGNDQLFIRDGELDQANCGAGADTVQADQLDVFAVDGFQACESVDRQTVAVPGAPGPVSAAAALGLKVPSSIRSKALLKRGLAFRLTCPGACKIAAELRYKSKKLGSARKTLKKAGLAKLVVKISKKAKRTVRRLKRGNLTLRLKVTDAAGKTTSLTKTIKFKH